MLRDWLAQRGYAIEDRTQSVPPRGKVPGTPSSLTNRILTCTSGACTVRFVLDRGAWTLQIYGSGFRSPAHSADTWHACLAGQEQPVRDGPLAQQVNLLQEDLPAIEAAIADDPAIEQKLDRTMRERLMRQYPTIVRTADVDAPLPPTPFRPPEEVERLWAWLEAQGFNRDEYYAALNFGDRVLRFTDAHLDIEFWTDRGLWFIDLAGKGFPQFYDVWLWRACIEGTPYRVDGTPAEKMAQTNELIAHNAERVATAANWLQQSFEELLRIAEHPAAVLECFQVTLHGRT